jgi:hypothetical protein
VPDTFFLSIAPWIYLLVWAGSKEKNWLESFSQIPGIQRGIQFNLLIPGSSANISDLDQAAALATALALALMAPLGTLASRTRAYWVKRRTYRSTD